MEKVDKILLKTIFAPIYYLGIMMAFFFTSAIILLSQINPEGAILVFLQTFMISLYAWQIYAFFYIIFKLYEIFLKKEEEDIKNE